MQYSNTRLPVKKRAQPSQRCDMFLINHGDQVFFQFEIIINVLVSSFRL